jgi:hypothetical protein
MPKNWLAVQRVADALLESKKLTSTETVAIIERAYGIEPYDFSFNAKQSAE